MKQKHTIPLSHPQINEPSAQQQHALVSLFNQGKFEQVALQAQLMTKRFPLHGFAWKVLGTVFKQTGRIADALAAMKRAATLSPGDAETHNNLGMVHKSAGTLVEADACLRRALLLNPEYAAAYNNHGLVLHGLGRLGEAVACYRRALSIHPDYAQAHCNLGNALRDLGCPSDAVASFKRAIDLNLRQAEVYSGLANALRDMGQLQDAVANYQCALQIDPNYAAAHSNLANVLHETGHLDLAVASARRAIEINPEFAEAHNNLGNVLKELGQINDAVKCYTRSLDINPDYANAHNNLGTALQDLGQLEAARSSYHRALALDPAYTVSQSNLLFIGNYLSDKPAADLLNEARRFGDGVARNAHRDVGWSNRPDPDKCLSVGLVSGDLFTHPVGYFTENVLAELAQHYTGRVQVTSYVTQTRSDAVTERIKSYCRHWTPVNGLSDEALANQIRDDGIDILIDLSGHTARNRLPMFAWKPAPVQITWLGYFATTGVAAIDYLIADPWTLPQSEESNFTETIWRLPQTRLCFTPPEVALAVAPAPSLRNGYITFGCFNNLTKMNSSVLALWARVLSAVPGSRLFLKTKQLQEASVRQAILEHFEAAGIASSRILLEGVSPRAQYLAAYERVDIALDPFPFPGGTTSVEGLWMGVPVLTLAGQRFLSRQGVGILMNAGLPDWIAADANDYVAKAVAHASDLHRLAELRNGLRQQVLASPLCDAPRFAGHFAAALRGMWQKWCDCQQRQAIQQ